MYDRGCNMCASLNDNILDVRLRYMVILKIDQGVSKEHPMARQRTLHLGLAGHASGTSSAQIHAVILMRRHLPHQRSASFWSRIPFGEIRCKSLPGGEVSDNAPPPRAPTTSETNIFHRADSKSIDGGARHTQDPQIMRRVTTCPSW